MLKIINTVNMWATFYHILRLEKYICNTFSALSLWRHSTEAISKQPSNSNYYINFSGIQSNSRSIKTLSRYHFYPHMCDIIFDQSAPSIFARCQVLVAACDTNKQLTVSLCSQVQTLVFEIKRIKHLSLYMVAWRYEISLL